MPILPGSRTIAAYPGECPCCGDPIEPGDPIEHDTDAGGWVLIEHDPPLDAPGRVTAEAACPRCFTVPAASGACLCDD